MMVALRPRARDTDKTASDAELCARIAGGEVAALGQLFDRHAEAVRRVVGRLGVRPGDVDDVAQATFLDVLEAAKGYDGRASARPWLVGMAVIRVRRHRRSLARLATKLAVWSWEPKPEVETPEVSVELRQKAARAERALASLSDKKREVFVLAALEGLPGEEVAKSLGIPVATVWTRLHHARIELREALMTEER